MFLYYKRRKCKIEKIITRGRNKTKFTIFLVNNSFFFRVPISKAQNKNAKKIDKKQQNILWKKILNNFINKQILVKKTALHLRKPLKKQREIYF